MRGFQGLQILRSDPEAVARLALDPLREFLLDNQNLAVPRKNDVFYAGSSAADDFAAYPQELRWSVINARLKTRLYGIQAPVVPIPVIEEFPHEIPVHGVPRVRFTECWRKVRIRDIIPPVVYPVEGFVQYERRDLVI